MSKKLIYLVSFVLVLSMAGKGWPSSNPDPADGATYPRTSLAMLLWTGGATAASYDVYFGDNFDEVNNGTGDTFRGNYTWTIFLPDALVRGTTYFWRIDDVAADGTKTKGTVWSFLVHPKNAYDPNPVDGAESVGLDVILGWAEGYNAFMQTVYFGDNYDIVSNATTGGTSVGGSTTHDPGPLEPGKDYFWRVDTLSPYGLIKGDVWSLTTKAPLPPLPSAPTNPSPSEGATNQSIDVGLSWSLASGATSYDVYFGTDPTPDSGEYKGNQTSTSYNPGLLDYNTTYYVRIDAKNAAGTTTGKVWSFTTVVRPPVRIFHSEPPSKSTSYALPYKPCPPCPCPPCPKPEGVGDPIYAFSGEYYKSVVDLRIAGRGLDFIWARKYRSRIGPDTAQGNGWDFSYNIRIERDGANIVLFDGNTRKDSYLPEGNGTWAADGFFQEFTQNNPNDPDSSFTLTFSDTGTWQFHRLDHAQAPGRISAITDRNGNTIHLDYDTQGRLVTVHDTLDTEAHNRDITIAYNQDGFIESVTDFIGRQVRYAYYQDGDDGGSFGDLKSVTTPAVTGTPNGNDFPQGKTTVYAYSKGFAEERLNHNLLTITDPKGQTYLTNIYAPTQNPQDLNFDRVTRQIWGDPGDILDLTYVRPVPSEQNGFADVKAVVNDRVGNVQEHFFDSDNQRVVQREYTGRADPDQPTTETQNRPTGKLRPDDPDFFETRWIYNADSLVSQIGYPNGNSTMNLYETDLNPVAPRRSRANLLWVYHMPGSLESLSGQSMIMESYEYDTNMGGCCATNFVTRAVDGRGNETLHEYDDRGNRILTQHRIPSVVEEWEYNEFGQMTKHTLPDNGSGHRRVDRYTYYSWDSSNPNPQNGYLKSIVVDVDNLALTTMCEHDAVGNVLRTTDPRGNDAQLVYNQLNQVVRRISRPVTSSTDVRYERDTYYDKNDNLVRVDTQNIDDQGVLLANTHLTTIYEYDVLNHLIRQSTEVDNYTGPISGPPELPSTAGLPETEFITTEYEYDAKRNRILVRYGEATEGRQLTNVVRSLYDERDLVFKQIRADGDPDQATTQYDYDGNGNVRRILQGLENNPRITISTYDGYDRLVASTDAMGNSVVFGYDENSNRISQRADGELIDVPGGADNVRLSEKTYVYDAMDRPIRTEIAFFDSNTQIPIDDGLSVTEIKYSDTSQIIRVTNDNSHAGEITYDTANRKLTVTDAKGNTLTYTYDENSNVISATTVEKSDLGNPDETFTTTSTYDGLDRLIRSVDNVGNTQAYSYDSRSNLTRTVDSLDHERRYVRDGINRLVRTIRDLDDDGADGDGDDVATSQTWDDTSRLTGRIDDNGNATSYVYDALNRSMRTTYADGTQRRVTYDVHDNRLTLIDGNGSVSAGTYDLVDRLTNKAITPGVGVSDDTTFEGYAYDGLSRLVRAEDDDSVVTRSYNSLSNATSATLNGQTIACLYDGIGNKVSCTYPGGRQIDCTFDEVERKRVVSDGGGTIATYNYVGPGRVERREFGNNTRTDYTYDGITGIPNPTGDFGVKRLIATTHTFDPVGAATIIDSRAYTWDKMYNKTQRKDIRVGGPKLTHDYQYDSIYRLVHTTVADTGTTLVRDEVYQFDGVGNRTQISGGADPGTYTMDPAMPVPSDHQMNQCTTTPSDTRAYDENGNLVTIDSGLSTAQNLTFDYRNRLIEYIGAQRHTYAYDALGRRIARVVDADGVPQETRYFYDGWRVCEEQDASGATQATYVYGLYIDEVLNMRRGGQDYYYHTDDLYNVMAVTDNTGAVMERHEYADYGSPLDPTTLAPVGGDPSAVGNPYLFHGRRYDPETGFYYFRNRYHDPSTGRFIQRDPVMDLGNMGNLYTFVGNNPIARMDPSGLQVTCIGLGLSGVAVAGAGGSLSYCWDECGNWALLLTASARFGVELSAGIVGSISDGGLADAIGEFRDISFGFGVASVTFGFDADWNFTGISGGLVLGAKAGVSVGFGAVEKLAGDVSHPYPCPPPSTLPSAGFEFCLEPPSPPRVHRPEPPRSDEPPPLHEGDTTEGPLGFGPDTEIGLDVPPTPMPIPKGTTIYVPPLDLSSPLFRTRDCYSGK